MLKCHCHEKFKNDPSECFWIDFVLIPTFIKAFSSRLITFVGSISHKAYETQNICPETELMFKTKERAIAE